MLGQDTCAEGPCELKRGPQLWQKPTPASAPSLDTQVQAGARGTRGLR